MRTTVYFKFERATKRTYRFHEVTEDGIPTDVDTAKIGVLYVKQSAFNHVQPTALLCTIETAD